MNDGPPLDMRMDPTRGVSAAQFIATAPWKKSPCVQGIR